jgi:hypothetical protein
VRGIPQRIVDRVDLERHFGIAMPDVELGNGDQLRKGAVAVHAHAQRVGAEVAASGQAVPAMAADDVSFGTDEITDLVTMHVAAHRDDASDEFVACDGAGLDGLLGPRVPIVDMHVGAADARLQDPDQNVIDAVGRLRHVFEPNAFAGFGLHKRFHENASKAVTWPDVFLRIQTRSNRGAWELTPGTKLSKTQHAATTMTGPSGAVRDWKQGT